MIRFETVALSQQKPDDIIEIDQNYKFSKSESAKVSVGRENSNYRDTETFSNGLVAQIRMICRSAIIRVLLTKLYCLIPWNRQFGQSAVSFL